ncbi:UNVERIFIED_CONTAM: hypothetical protein FKN15_044993 [Acipenser sinensis]
MFSLYCPSLTAHPGASKPCCFIMVTSTCLFPWLTRCTSKDYNSIKILLDALKNEEYGWDPRKVLMPLLHIKLGLMKQFVRALDKESAAFKYLQVPSRLLP